MLLPTPFLQCGKDAESSNNTENNKSAQTTSASPVTNESESSTQITFIELGSVECVPCKAMQPVMKAIEQKYNGKVKVIFYDVWTDQGAPYAAQYGIQAIPTQIFIDKNGKEFYRHTGFYPENAIDRVIASMGVKP